MGDNVRVLPGGVLTINPSDERTIEAFRPFDMNNL